MKTKMMELNEKAKKLVIVSKQKGIIKSHTEAFKDFPVRDEIHKGKDRNSK